MHVYLDKKDTVEYNNRLPFFGLCHDESEKRGSGKAELSGCYIFFEKNKENKEN